MKRIPVSISSARIPRTVLSCALASSLALALPAGAAVADEAPDSTATQAVPDAPAGASDADEAAASAASTLSDAQIKDAVSSAEQATGVPGEDIQSSEAVDAAQAAADEPAGREGGSPLAPQELKGLSGLSTFAGDTMYETAVAEARAAYPNGSNTAIIAGPGDAWVDALAAAALAGSHGPILFARENSIHPATMQALKDLGVREAIIVGGTAAVGEGAADDLRGAGIGVTRLAGQNALGTQLDIFKYGLKHKLWTSGEAYVATSAWYGDALSISPVSYAKRAPIFLVNGLNGFNAEQRAALEAAFADGTLRRSVIVGGTAAVGEDIADYLAGLSPEGRASVERLAGATQYETSAEIAGWSVRSRGFAWNNVAFTTGRMPYDALAGSVLQGKFLAPLLLVDERKTYGVGVAGMNRAGITSARVFGGTAAVTPSTRGAIFAALSGTNLSFEDTGLTLDRMVDLEDANDNSIDGKNGYYSPDQLRHFIDPSRFTYGSALFYQFAVLNKGYSGVLTADQLNEFIDQIAPGYERNWKAHSKLRGTGQAFIDAAHESGVNELYLLAHAILESACGCSPLSQGTRDVAPGYLNFFGIGAYDSNPDNGASYAKSQGWDTPEKAIKGGARWIAQGRSRFINNEWNQNTLYKMKWNYEQGARQGTVWKQYATAAHWPDGISNLMAQCYQHHGITLERTGLEFLVPQYR
ncbi:hypothetical protein HLV37_05715 [Eggerthellaceae bacterium zg-1084]|uniref:cell wall-binding repeat-containing protein n=1 Tax=Berryella wangjianweii TaxID=2734634 RepID=UPI0015524DA7|nr:cell wall-binding repeat-containing protein [Berryella wangjianweii]NPD31359.1 hypothetical protein [Berryella wangjianweii]